MSHFLSRFTHCPACGSTAFVATSNRSKRCDDCSFEYYLNASGAYVAFIHDGEGRLLVVRRAKQPALGTLDLPGGFADPGETAEEGVAREVGEETGLTLCSASYLFSIPNRYDYSGMTIPTLDLFFSCRADHPEQAVAADDAGELLWLDRGSVKPDEFGLASVREGVERYLKTAWKN